MGRASKSRQGSRVSTMMRWLFSGLSPDVGPAEGVQESGIETGIRVIGAVIAPSFCSFKSSQAIRRASGSSTTGGCSAGVKVVSFGDPGLDCFAWGSLPGSGSAFMCQVVRSADRCQAIHFGDVPRMFLHRLS
jgi:hypothetical protein